MNKIAVFVSGPVRHLNYVLESVNEAMSEKNLKYDFFIHVWKDDVSNKPRNSDFCISTIIPKTQIKSLQIERSLDVDKIEKKYDSWTDTHSTITAMVGMFIGINKLISILEISPDYDDYTHILRLRTDIKFCTGDFFRNVDFDSKRIHVAKNNLIPPSWVSDHLMLATVSDFVKIWKYPSFPYFMNKFSLYARNPEYYLGKNINKRKLVIAWKRYEDYHIVYDTLKSSDPDFINNFQSGHSLSELYQWKFNQEDLLLAKKFNNELEKNFSNYKNPFRVLIRAIKSRVNRKKAY